MGMGMGMGMTGGGTELLGLRRKLLPSGRYRVLELPACNE